MIRRLLRALSSPSIENEAGDVLPGDLAREDGATRVGLVESVKNDHATIAWGRDNRSILPVMQLRRVRRDGDNLDRRRP